MNKILIIILLILTSGFTLFSQNELNNELKELVDKGKFNISDSLFAEFTKGNLMEPQIYIDYANILFNKSRKSIVNLTNDTLIKNDEGFAIKDSSGKIAGSIKELVTYDTTLTHKAIEILRKSLLKFDYRLDIRFGIAYMYQQIGDFENQYNIIVDAIAFSKNNSNKIRWINEDKFEGSPLNYVANAVYDYSIEEYNKETIEGDEHYFNLSKLLTEQFPEHSMSYTNIAYYYYNKKDWNNSLKYFKIANDKHPNDNNILYNLAENHIMLKDLENGKIYLNQIIQLNTDIKFVNYATQRLKELK